MAELIPPEHIEQITKIVDDGLQRQLKSLGLEPWSRSVLKNLDELNEKYTSMNEKQQKLHTTLEVLKSEVKIKSGLWGALAGLISVIFALAILFLKNKVLP